MKVIVTVKLPKNPAHDPKHKRTGICPVSSRLCTDVTGEHHSILVEGSSLIEIAEKAGAKWRITRMEIAEP
jgi:hypothetical protein